MKRFSLGNLFWAITCVAFLLLAYNKHEENQDLKWKMAQAAVECYEVQDFISASWNKGDVNGPWGIAFSQAHSTQRNMEASAGKKVMDRAWKIHFENQNVLTEYSWK